MFGRYFLEMFKEVYHIGRREEELFERLDVLLGEYHSSLEQLLLLVAAPTIHPLDNNDKSFISNTNLSHKKMPPVNIIWIQFLSGYILPVERLRLCPDHECQYCSHQPEVALRERLGHRQNRRRLLDVHALLRHLQEG